MGKEEILSIIDNNLIQNVSVTLKRLEPVAKRILGFIDQAITDFRILKTDMDNQEVVENISRNMEDLHAVSHLLYQYLEDVIKGFDSAINMLSYIIEDAAEKKDINKVAMALHAQKILFAEKEYIRSVRENAITLDAYGSKYGIKGINYSEEILKAARTDQLTQKLEAIKSSIKSILIDKERSTVRSLEEIRKQLENFPKLEELGRN